ncbi:12873_t:CDS:2 [Rhizophagus irregularis]|nr:12873_t:CDS:2 [Rhizophagus irregularis]
MARGYSLEQDLKLLVNNPKYSDIEILCEDQRKLYGSRAILAARSEVFDGLLYNGMKESYENQIYFPTINSSIMEIILEYIYTGSIKGTLTEDNIVEVFSAADYFQLLNLQDFIIKNVKNTLVENYKENYSPELLSKVMDKMVLTDDNNLLNLLVEAVATIPLNTIKFGRLSISALQYLLSCTHKKQKPFATTEYEVFRYCSILAAKQVSNDAYITLIKRLPTLEQLENENSIIIENEIITNRQEVSNKLKPLVKFIDFGQIKVQILTDIIEPLEITPTVTKIMENVKVKMILENKGIFKWDVIIEKDCEYAWVGVCSSENFNYEIFAGSQHSGLVLGSNGCCFNSGDWVNNYCPPFKEGAMITVHLDMNKRTCAFTVNGIRYSEVSGWSNSPLKLSPAVSLCYPGRLRIQNCRKI